MFTRDLIDETLRWSRVLALAGRCQRPAQGTPRLAAEGARPCGVSTTRKCDSSIATRTERPSLRYAATLLAQNNTLVPALLLEIIDGLGRLFPPEQAILQVMPR